MTDQRRVVQALIELGLGTAGQGPDRAVQVVYLKHLQEFETAAIVGACERLAKKAKFFPPVSEIIEEIRGSTAALAESAWDRACSLTRSPRAKIHEAYAADPAMALAIRKLGGLSAIGERTTKDEPFMRRRFLEHYLGAGTDLENPGSAGGPSRIQASAVMGQIRDARAADAAKEPE